MKFLSFQMAARRFARDGSPGWTEWGRNPERILEIAGKADRAEWGGISLDRACGAHYHARFASTDVNGDLIHVYPAGPDDHPYPVEIGDKLRAMGFEVCMFGGWPRYASGFLEIQRLTDAGYIIPVDSSGGATNGDLVTRFGATPEPMPMPARTPPWFTAECEPYMLADRADTLDRLGILPRRCHIKWNGYEDGDSFYDAAEVRAYLTRGHCAHVPVAHTVLADPVDG